MLCTVPSSTGAKVVLIAPVAALKANRYFWLTTAVEPWFDSVVNDPPVMICVPTWLIA